MGPDGLPRSTTSFGEARRVLNLDIPGDVGGTNPNQMPEYVMDSMKNTIKAVTDAGSILWTGYGKVDAALREIASSTHSARVSSRGGPWGSPPGCAIGLVSKRARGAGKFDGPNARQFDQGPR